MRDLPGLARGGKTGSHDTCFDAVAGALVFPGLRQWVPDWRFAPSGMTCPI